MEQRLHPREPVKFTVRLIQQGHIAATAQAIDMSLYGLGIRRPSMVLNSGQIVDVDLTKSGYPRGVSCCVPYMVVHAGPESVGLMLANDSDLNMSSAEHGIKSSDDNDQGVSHDKSTAT